MTDSIRDETSEDASAKAEFQPIPGVTMHGLRGLLIAAKQNPDTEESTVAGLRALISSQGNDPDRIIAEAMGTGTDTKPGEDGLVGAFVDFKGRRIEVKAPSVEQIVVIKRLQKRFTDAAAETNLTAERAVAMMNRALTAILSIVANQDDKEFVEDLWLDAAINMEETLPLLTRAMKCLEEANANQQNRATRRATERAGTGTAELVVG